MAVKYRIEYDEYSQYQRKPRALKPGAITVVIAICVTLTLLLLRPATGRALLDALLPGDAAVTKAALERLSDSLDYGVSLPDAMDVFCNAVMDGE